MDADRDGWGGPAVALAGTSTTSSPKVEDGRAALVTNEKLGVGDRAAAVAEAMRRGLLE